MKEAAELTGFPYPAIKGLLDFAHIKTEKQGGSLIVDKNDAVSAVLALRLAFCHPDDAEDIIDSVKSKCENAGSFLLEDGSKHAVKTCPFCLGDDLLLRQRYIDDKEMYYSFVQCKNCKASSGASSAYKDIVISEKEAIKNWNKRP